MIRLTVKKHCDRVGILNPHQLKLALGCHIDTATQLYHETLTRLDLAVLDKLCDVLKSSPNAIQVRTKNRKKK